MKSRDCKSKIQNKYKQKLKKHLTIGIIFVIMLIVLKIILIPTLKNTEKNYKPIIAIEHKTKDANLYLKINIKSNNKKELGKASLEVYLDNKLIENNMIYIDKIDYTLYTNVAYKNESLLTIMLINHKGEKTYFSKKLIFGG
ncbi:hypothetical protein CR532_00780 [Candidatus Borreliella tachyglossi]|uniref:Uncharacterized protein n=1 Tax=Candidatus Borreliella tachyglossi TaxID=1964448 RepID=A0A2S1LW69_9SPIR|nr:hypothetical protein [Candidatus Borreliella tachyglossi]AWG42547.1 hypothetical protein CR532_00780 [Candidatus Borreliella tachyglossi]